MKAKLCMVCAGNICRSPMAEAITKDALRQREVDWEISSRGTGAWHQGSDADPRTLKVLAQNGLELIGHRARRFSDDDFNYFDVILVMDNDNHLDLSSRVTDGDIQKKIHLYLAFADPSRESPEVPDPYFGDIAAFKEVFNLLSSTVDAVIDRVLRDIQEAN